MLRTSIRVANTISCRASRFTLASPAKRMNSSSMTGEVVGQLPAVVAVTTGFEPSRPVPACLKDEGSPAEDIAASSTLVVQRGFKLASVSPRLLADHRPTP
jgi:hypothetical protein